MILRMIAPGKRKGTEMRGLRLFLSLLISIVLLVLAGCDFTTEDRNGKAMSVKKGITEPAAGIKSLTCFKCHPYKEFSRVFPHDLHIRAGLHCTQCHIIKNHKTHALNKERCKKCHNLTVLNMKTSSMPVRFNHEKHTEMFDCKDCHTEVFPMKLNGKKIIMDEIFKGKYCGKCHNGETAFSSSDCNRCHKA
ncbi:MAG TPA: hypothetical protein ENH07_05835 [Nitrospirae bacterium]|nr:hypothetical protein [Nitrospirota bacterium]